MKSNFKILLIIVCTFFSLSAEAQVNEYKNFVYFKSDSVLYAKNVRLRINFVNSLQLRADSKKIPLQQVKFFNSDQGFFATGRKKAMLDHVDISERIIQGRINIFQERSYKAFSDNRPYVYHDHDQNQVNLRMYYNKGYGDLKKVNYRNLKMDIADDAVSLDLLEGYKRNMNTSKALYVAAGASIVASFVLFLVKAERDPLFTSGIHNQGSGWDGQRPQFNNKGPNFTAPYILLGAAAGFGLGGYAINLSGLRKLEETVDSYNR